MFCHDSRAIRSANRSVRNRFATAAIALLVLAAAGCATVGRDFAAGKVGALQIGKTTKEEVREMFGAPWRTGIEDGRQTWTYGKYRYSMFSPAKTQDLVVRFGADGKVVSYTYNTTEHNE